MNQLIAIGQPPWTQNDLESAIPEFEKLYESRPIVDNTGGMKSPHMFATWFMAKHLSPPLIVESGVYKGQSTWLLEQACPTARIIAIDPQLSQREYISDRVSYFDRDFSELDWSDEETQSALIFFDDHQDAYSRLQLCKWFGFRHIIFEDNYPEGQGDCYSLKKAFLGAGFEPSDHGGRRAKTVQKIARKLNLLPSIMPQYSRIQVDKNPHDAKALHRNLETYYEFPPLFKPDTTRWGDDWNEENYSTPAPLLSSAVRDQYPVFWNEAKSYTWICYAKLRD